ISSTSPSRRPTSSSESASKARHIRRSVPNWFTSSGCDEPFGFSNRSAGPPALTTRSTISVTSRCGSTSAETRASSPSRSRSPIQSRRSPGGAMTLVVAAVAEVAAELAEDDHAQEDEADDEHEPVGVEVVAEQERGVGIGWREQPRAAVVEEVALVDRLQPERVPLLAERREDCLELALLLRPKRGLPQSALARGLESDRLPEASRYSQRASSFVQYETTMSAPPRTIAVRDSSAASPSPS